MRVHIPYGTEPTPVLALSMDGAFSASSQKKLKASYAIPPTCSCQQDCAPLTLIHPQFDSPLNPTYQKHAYRSRHQTVNRPSYRLPQVTYLNAVKHKLGCHGRAHAALALDLLPERESGCTLPHPDKVDTNRPQVNIRGLCIARTRMIA